MHSYRIRRTIEASVAREEFTSSLLVNVPANNEDSFTDILEGIYHYVIVPFSMIITCIALFIAICLYLFCRRYNLLRFVTRDLVMSLIRLCNPVEEVVTASTTASSGATHARQSVRVSGNDDRPEYISVHLDDVQNDIEMETSPLHG